MKKVIVTGANGFLGTALCRELATSGIQVIAIIRNEEENVSNIVDLPGLRIVYCDFSEFKQLPEMIRERDIDVVYHLAWVGTAGPLRGNKDVQLNNIVYTCDTVQACAEMKCKKFVFAVFKITFKFVPSISTLLPSKAASMARPLLAPKSKPRKCIFSMVSAPFS